MTRLEYLRRQAGMTQKQLGESALLPRARISLFERGRVIPPRHGVELKRLAVALGLPKVDAGTLLDEVSGDGR